jgi:AraC family transcriptional regulator
MNSAAVAVVGPHLSRFAAGVSRQCSTIRIAGDSTDEPVRIPPGVTTLWMQLRGTTVIQSAEGRFELRRGGWLLLGRAAEPLLQAGHLGICVGICLSADTRTALGAGASPLYPGMGRMPRGDLQMAARLWRRIALGPDTDVDLRADPRPLLLLMADLQRDIASRAARCPGPSAARKHQVMTSLQNACLFMHGHLERSVSARELAQWVGLPNRYFSEAFLAAYDQSPQQFGTRVRLEHAAARVRRGDMTVDEVAPAIGFKHAGTFLRAFRASFGVSLGNYCAR